MNILITGGSSGLGKSIVQNLSSNTNYKIYFTYNSGINVSLELEKKYFNVKAFHCDFTNDKSVSDFCEILPSLEIDVLINNAYVGKALNDNFFRSKIEDFDKSFKYNILPTIKITQHAIKIFKQKKFGKIINILTSYLLNSPPIGTSIYVANKAYLLELSKVWSKELTKFNITSNSISPDLMITNLSKDIDQRVLDQITESHPYKKLLDTNEVMAAVEFLIKSSRFVNGINIPINAGQNII
jgi:NAD(P)-dependent dehydrogenase (short-subunit alcohol dehydrogenase family)